MIEMIVYFGVAQTIFAATLLLTKKKLKIADKILAAWLFTISCSFIINLIKIRLEMTEGLWILSAIPVLTYFQYLFLYSKYISKEYDKFSRKDYLHFLPAVGSLIFALSFYISKGMPNIKTFAIYASQSPIPQHVFGNAFVVCLWLYSILTVLSIRKYKKQIANYYSFESRRISLNWLLFLAISLFILYHVSIMASVYQVKTGNLLNVEIFRSGSLLFFVYVLSFGGLRQQQLASEEKPIKINQESSIQDSSSNRYKKSGLKDDQAEIYLNQLVDYMNQSETWKDNELSVAKLAEQTEIPKYYITQILNENLHKNFYTFVNEYRTEYAKQLIKSPKYENWSLLAIAYECGFNSKSAFNNFFKKYTDMTPTDYKNQYSNSKK